MFGSSGLQLQLDSIVRRTMKEADKDEDNLIDFEEFKQVNWHNVMHATSLVCVVSVTSRQNERRGGGMIWFN